MIIIGLILLIITSFLVYKYSTKWYEIGQTICFTSSVSLLCLLISIGLFYLEDKSKLEEYYALKNTIKIARQNGTCQSERASILLKIIEKNEEISKDKYWNKTILGIFVADEVAELPFLE